jgi:hypothetical protein
MLLEITFFAVTLFLALVALMNWKHRRDEIAARLNRGLRGYVAQAPQRRAATMHGSLVYRFTTDGAAM